MTTNNRKFSVSFSC